MSSQVKIKCTNINKLNCQSGQNDVNDVPELTEMEQEIKDVFGEIAIQGVTGGIDTQVEMMQGCSYESETDQVDTSHRSDNIPTIQPSITPELPNSTKFKYKTEALRRTKPLNSIENTKPVHSTKSSRSDTFDDQHTDKALPTKRKIQRYDESNDSTMQLLDIES